MSYRAYVCNFFKELQIGNNARGIKFQNGFFETDDPEIQQVIETSQGFGVHIHLKDSLEEMERIGKERQEAAAGEKAKRKKEVLDEIAADDKAESDKKAKLEAEAKKASEKRKTIGKLAAADKVLHR